MARQHGGRKALELRERPHSLATHRAGWHAATGDDGPGGNVGIDDGELRFVQGVGQNLGGDLRGVRVAGGLDRVRREHVVTVQVVGLRLVHDRPIGFRDALATQDEAVPLVELRPGLAAHLGQAVHHGHGERIAQAIGPGVHQRQFHHGPGHAPGQAVRQVVAGPAVQCAGQGLAQDAVCLEKVAGVLVELLADVAHHVQIRQAVVVQRGGDGAHVRGAGEHRAAQLGRRLDVAHVLPDLRGEPVLRRRGLARYDVPVTLWRVEGAAVLRGPGAVGALGDVGLQPELLLGIRAVPLHQTDVACHVPDVAHHGVVQRALAELVHVGHPGIAVLEVQHPAVAAAVRPGAHTLEVARAGLVQATGGDGVLRGLEHGGQFRVVHQGAIDTHVLLTVEHRQHLGRPRLRAGLHDLDGVMHLRQVAVPEFADIAARRVEPQPQRLDRVQPCLCRGLGDGVAGGAVGVGEHLAHDVARDNRVVQIEDPHAQVSQQPGAVLAAHGVDHVRQARDGVVSHGVDILAGLLDVADQGLRACQLGRIGCGRDPGVGLGGAQNLQRAAVFLERGLCLNVLHGGDSGLGHALLTGQALPPLAVLAGQVAHLGADGVVDGLQLGL